jgi:septal ring factor EnvC (AmiA/AmiB activator)
LRSVALAQLAALYPRVLVKLTQHSLDSIQLANLGASSPKRVSPSLPPMPFVVAPSPVKNEAEKEPQPLVAEEQDPLQQLRKRMLDDLALLEDYLKKEKMEQKRIEETLLSKDDQIAQLSKGLQESEQQLSESKEEIILLKAEVASLEEQIKEKARKEVSEELYLSHSLGRSSSR